MARRLGATAQELAALEHGELALFEPAARAALRFSEQLTLDSNHVDEVVFANLRAHFDEGQIIEIAAVAGLFNYFNRFNNALHMEPTR